MQRQIETMFIARRAHGHHKVIIDVGTLDAFHAPDGVGRFTNSQNDLGPYSAIAILHQ
jgi:hypothetical protein